MGQVLRSKFPLLDFDVNRQSGNIGIDDLSLVEVDVDAKHLPPSFGWKLARCEKHGINSRAVEDEFTKVVTTAKSNSRSGGPRPRRSTGSDSEPFAKAK
eukprot:6987467-Karenia_brevis.AAC.1